MKLNATTNPVIRAAHTATSTMSTATGSGPAADERDRDQGCAYRRRANRRSAVSPRRSSANPRAATAKAKSTAIGPPVNLAATSDEGRFRRSVTCASSPSPGTGVLHGRNCYMLITTCYKSAVLSGKTMRGNGH